ncbi:hypothetical protein LB513_06495 [Mesorhizobium sp. ES1-1]|nr:hypothetical protein [Mesorhizobium sp. ES1-1]
MAYIAFSSNHATPNRLTMIADWLRHARVAAKLPLPDVEDLSDQQLRDIGARRSDVTRAMDSESGRLGLLALGWRQPRR